VTLSRRTGLAASALLTAVLLVAAIGIVAPPSVRGECVFIDPWPRITEAAPSAERVVIGRVSDVRTRRRRPNDEPRVVGFSLTVTEEVKGTGSRRLRFGEIVTDTGCITSRLWVRDGDRLAMAFGGRAKGIDGRVSAVAFMGSAPAVEIARAGGPRRMPLMERVTPIQVRQASRLPVGPLLLFIADDGDGPAIWRTDGTARGTRVVRRPGPEGPTDPRELVHSDGLVYFTASDVKHGRELWVTDGTAAGTRQLRDIRSGALGSDPDELTAGPPWHGGITFAADDAIHGREPWRTDGSPRGTRLLRDVNEGREGAAGSDPQSLLLLNFNLTLSVDDGIRGRELWPTFSDRDDEILDVMPGPEGSDPRHLTEAGPHEFFVADGPHGTGTLYGCADSCYRYAAFGIDGRIVTGVSETAGVERQAFFVADDGAGSSFLGVARPVDFGDWTQQDWWDDVVITVDGARRILTAPSPSTDPPASGPFGELTAFDGRLFLAVDSAGSGTELWASDGTPEGTGPVLDLGGADLDPEGLTAASGRLWFSADPDDGTAREPWVSDGTADGTVAVADLRADGGSDPAGFTAFGGLVAFSADDGVHGRELWVSDGTEKGTQLVLDIRRGPEGSEPASLAVLQGRR
jgi:ELWxxDGT repeat protein